MYDWYRSTVLHRLLPTSKKSLAPQRFWDHMGYLDEEAITAIEDDLTKVLLDEFGIDTKMLLWDATNFDTFIDTQTSGELAQRGKAKSKRSDLRVIGMALLTSVEYGIPLLSHVYPGNRNDAAMFSDALKRLSRRYAAFAGDGGDLTMVFDGGNTSESNIKNLEEAGYNFITSLTVTNHKDLLAVKLSKYESFDNPRLAGTTAYRAQKAVWGKERVVVVTRSEGLLQGQLAGIEASLTKKRRALNELRGKLKKSQQSGARGKGYTYKSLKKNLKKIISGQYIKEILKATIGEDDGRLSFTFTTDQAAYARLQRERLGKRIYCTDNIHWSTEDIILGGRDQYHIEDAFRQMKNPNWVSFTPTFHWTDQKLRVHAFYCLLALLMSSLLTREAGMAGLQLSTERMYRELSGMKEVLSLKSDTKTGRIRSHRQLTERTELQQELFYLFQLESVKG
jgi:transposase